MDVHNITGETIGWLINAVPGQSKTDLSLPNTLGYSAVANGDLTATAPPTSCGGMPASGDVLEWLMADAAAGGIGFQASLDNTAGRSVLASGDFNGDGTLT